MVFILFNTILFHRNLILIWGLNICGPKSLGEVSKCENYKFLKQSMKKQFNLNLSLFATSRKKVFITINLKIVYVLLYIGSTIGTLTAQTAGEMKSMVPGKPTRVGAGDRMDPRPDLWYRHYEFTAMGV